MKTYRGVPGPPPVVTVQASGGRPMPLDPAITRLGCGWGDPGADSARLAVALLADVLGDEQAERVTRVYRRFMHRVVSTWTKASPWSITDAEILGQVADIEKTEKDTAQSRRMIATEVPQMLVDRVPVGWDAGGRKQDPVPAGLEEDAAKRSRRKP